MVTATGRISTPYGSPRPPNLVGYGGVDENETDNQQHYCQHRLLREFVDNPDSHQYADGN